MYRFITNNKLNQSRHDCNGGASIVKAGWDIETQKGENSIGLHYLYK